MPDETKPTDDSQDNPQPAESLPRQNVVDDEQTDLAVDDISRRESDELLAGEDKRADSDFSKILKPRSRWSRWWHNPKSRYGTILVVIAILLAAGLIKPSRWFILNHLGFRTSASLQVDDGTTKLPLQNVKVELEGRSANTNSKGFVSLNELKFGLQKVVVQKAGFAQLERQIIVNLGQNSLGKVDLKAVGIQYRFNVVDYLSGQPIGGAATTSGKSSAFSNDSGHIILSVINRSASTITASISAKNYITAQVAVDFGGRSQTAAVRLVPAGQDVFISNSSGRYDVYKADLDGKNSQLLLAGTGNENPNITLSVSPDNKQAALVDTRDNMRDASGNLLQTLTIINIATGTPLVIDHAQDLQLVDWLSGHLVYTASDYAGTTSTSRIMSYSVATNQRSQLDVASGFSAVDSTKGQIYYAPASSVSAPGGFFVVNADGSGTKKLFAGQVWTVFRTDYSTLDLQTPDSWYTYTPGFQAPNPIAAPANPINYNFFDSPDGSNSLWTDLRNGQGTLLEQDISTAKNKVLVMSAGVQEPVRWLSNSVAIYRVSNSDGTADYVLNVNGGSPQKIANVAANSGLQPSD